MASKVLPSGGLAVKVIGSRKTKRLMAEFPVLVQRKVMRLATAAGARPVAAKMREELKKISRESKRHEGIGTASRSVTVKAASSKKDPNISYAVVGARRGYMEIATLRAGVGGRHKRAVKGIEVHTPWKKVKKSNLKKWSPWARRARLRPMKYAKDYNKRIPSKYFHLLERGRYKTPPMWAGRHFAQKTAQATAAMVQLLMRRNIAMGVKREWERARRAP